MVDKLLSSSMSSSSATDTKFLQDLENGKNFHIQTHRYWVYVCRMCFMRSSLFEMCFLLDVVVSVFYNAQ